MPRMHLLTVAPERLRIQTVLLTRQTLFHPIQFLLQLPIENGRFLEVAVLLSHCLRPVFYQAHLLKILENKLGSLLVTLQNRFQRIFRHFDLKHFV